MYNTMLRQIQVFGGRFRNLSRVRDLICTVSGTQSLSTNVDTKGFKVQSDPKVDASGQLHRKNSSLNTKEGFEAGGRVDLDFSDAEKAFKGKSTGEIFRALVVLKVCAYDFIVNNGVKWMELSQKFLGRRLSDIVLKSTFYGQFVAGENAANIKTSSDKLRQAGISGLIAIPLEEDVGETSKRDREAWYDKNIDIMIECVDLTVKTSDHSKPLLMQMRISPLVPPELLVKISQMITQDSFHDGTDGPLSIQNIAKGLQQNGEMNIIIPGLSDGENKQLKSSLQRLDKMTQHAVNNKTKVLVDAEYSYLNPAMTLITLALMYKYNRPEPYVWNTYQSYLKESHSNICRDVDIAQKLGFGFGIKLVRGAYMDKERLRAKEMGYEDPINETYGDTNNMYDKNLVTMLELIREHNRKFNIIVASHNEASVNLAMEKMHQFGIGPQDGTVTFGQLLGMCDQVSYALGQAGYLVYKSMPVGTVDEVIPYLSRRASENRSVLAGARREQQLLWGEFKRRMKMTRS